MRKQTLENFVTKFKKKSFQINFMISVIVYMLTHTQKWLLNVNMDILLK